MRMYTLPNTSAASARPLTSHACGCFPATFDLFLCMLSLLAPYWPCTLTLLAVAASAF